MCAMLCPLLTRGGGPHLRAVILIHPIGRNLKNLARPRHQNDTTAIRYGHAVIATDTSNRIRGPRFAKVPT